MSPPRSRTIWAEDRLRHAIVSGELAPGERVLIEPLAQAWDLSATPLREALRTLAGEGLVVLDAQRGARIAPVSEQELTEVYELRLIVEPLAFRLSVLACDETWLDRLDVAWAALQTAHAARPSSPLDLEPAHTEFHFALVANCGSDALLRLVSVLATQALRFRTLAAHATAGRKPPLARRAPSPPRPRAPGRGGRRRATPRRASLVAADRFRRWRAGASGRAARRARPVARRRGTRVAGGQVREPRAIARLRKLSGRWFGGSPREGDLRLGVVAGRALWPSLRWRVRPPRTARER